ncbi:MAG TPA: hypothetical protein VKC66_33950 [Xanthobacteraceae bacterium]|nr:hypothetical protein [Xanthobacteraceae bacterium]
MVARARTQHEELTVTFQRDGEPPEHMVARSPLEAWDHALLLISRRDALYVEDSLTVRRADTVEDEQQ